MSKNFCCPNCGNKDLQAVVETTTTNQTTGSGFSAGKGCLGYLLLGPLGILCGSCGNNQKTTVNTKSETFWVCSKCGHKFKSPDDLHKAMEEKDPKKSIIPATACCILSIILFALFSFAGVDEARLWSLVIFAVFLLMGVVTYFGMAKQREKLKSEIEQLEREMAKFEGNENN